MLRLDIPVYIASKSPRRKKILKQLGIKFKSISIDVPEKFIRNEDSVTAVKRLAYEKLLEAQKHVRKGIIITADTIVVLDSKIIGKPKHKKDAVKILKSLSGKKHFVFTGFCIYNSVNNKIKIDYEKTEVYFRELKKHEIDDYIKTGSPFDKAGAYGIQDDLGAVFIRKINGCYYNVMGLPLSKVYSCLEQVMY
ncbi:MAG: septum formation protein Maf [Bacteroidetes bacterium]|nr:septum formation protein Maf [Bacteroidota bacterium]MBU1678994.1 septum formation protein Maf [Bacteroidota bacterium]MBU2506013.1 septum formation protein Maf [Bacteroidota bacterium]